MQKFVFSFLGSCLVGIAVYLFSLMKSLIVWFAQNPTMYTENFGYAIPFLLVVTFILVGRYYNKINFL